MFAQSYMQMVQRKYSRIAVTATTATATTTTATTTTTTTFFLLALQPPSGVVFYSPLADFSLLACKVS